RFHCILLADCSSHAPRGRVSAEPMDTVGIKNVRKEDHSGTPGAKRQPRILIGRRDKRSVRNLAMFFVVLAVAIGPLRDKANCMKKQTWPTLVSQWLYMTYRFIRFTALGGTVILPLLGATSVTPQPKSSLVVGLIAVAVAYHCFAYVLNDFVDLPI